MREGLGAGWESRCLEERTAQGAEADPVREAHTPVESLKTTGCLMHEKDRASQQRY